MKRPEVEAELFAYKHSLPPAAKQDLESLFHLLGSAQKKDSWLRAIVVAVCGLFGAGISTGIFYSHLATKSDISALERQYAKVSEDHAAQEQRQNDRLKDLEADGRVAAKCCGDLTGRVDRALTPPRIGPQP
jgi:hypothetical protein